ncbi:MAG: IclR family transcriptional regulator [Desulfobacterales bacterium]|nr:IclR family transcriptional regulator [Desulfobacterales bacterium]
MKSNSSEPRSTGRIIQSVDRAARAMGLFLKEGPELGIKDFARLLELPKPTVHSLVNTLAHHRLLEQNPENSKYRLGPTLLRLGLKYVKQSDFLSTIAVWMERLCYRFRKPVNVCMIVGHQAMVVYKVTPDEEISAFPDVGAVVPLHNTANGKVLVAFSDPAIKETLMEGYTYTQTTPTTITSDSAFKEELEQVFQTRLGFNREEGLPGITGIAAPIFNHTRQVIASFGISGDTGWFTENERLILTEIKKTAMAVSKQMGYSDLKYK